jgi:hypothetical protein
MALSEGDIEKIEKYRASIEARLSLLLRKSGSSVTLEDYKRAIYNGPSAPQFNAYLQEALDVFGCDVDSASDEILSTIQDAWNFFPHCSHNGKCPAELLAAGSDSLDALLN